MDVPNLLNRGTRTKRTDKSMKMKTEELIRRLKYIKRNENRGTHNVATRNNKSTDVPNLLNRGTRTKDRQINGNENRGTNKGKIHKTKQKTEALIRGNKKHKSTDVP